MSYLLKTVYFHLKNQVRCGDCCLLKTPTVPVVSQQSNENAGRTLTIQCSMLSAQVSVSADGSNCQIAYIADKFFSATGWQHFNFARLHKV